jgi:hypothetical protein
MSADGVDLADQKAVDAWLDDNGDLFGYQKEQEQSSQNQEVQNAHQKMSNVRDMGKPAGGADDEDVASIQAFRDRDELQAYLQKRQIKM